LNWESVPKKKLSIILKNGHLPSYIEQVRFHPQKVILEIFENIRLKLIKNGLFLERGNF